jgi:hypothetical protein
MQVIANPIDNAYPIQIAGSVIPNTENMFIEPSGKLSVNINTGDRKLPVP